MKQELNKNERVPLLVSETLIAQEISEEAISNGFNAQRPSHGPSSLSGRGKAASTKSLQSKLQDALTKPANRGILEAAMTVERIQKLRGIKF